MEHSGFGGKSQPQAGFRPPSYAKRAQSKPSQGEPSSAGGAYRETTASTGPSASTSLFRPPSISQQQTLQYGEYAHQTPYQTPTPAGQYTGTNDTTGTTKLYYANAYYKSQEGLGFLGSPQLGRPSSGAAPQSYEARANSANGRSHLHNPSPSYNHYGQQYIRQSYNMQQAANIPPALPDRGLCIPLYSARATKNNNDGQTFNKRGSICQGLELGRGLRQGISIDYQLQEGSIPPSTDPERQSFSQIRQETKTIASNILHTVFQNIDSFKPPEPNSYKDVPPFGLTGQQIQEILAAATAQYRTTAKSVVQVSTPCKVFGDLHGQFKDLLRLFVAFGKPCAYSGDLDAVQYVFNGDFVDRGPHSLEVLIFLICLRLVHESRIVLIRGNHEAEIPTKVYGFMSECNTRLGDYADTIFKETIEFFNHLPIAGVLYTPKSTTPASAYSATALSNSTFHYVKRALIVHGGIGPNVRRISELEAIRIPYSADDQPGIIDETLWSDPVSDLSQRQYSVNAARGATAFLFGEDAVTDFCRDNAIEIIIRSHQCVPGGFEYFAKGRMVTVFSAPNYCGTKGNDAAILYITGNPEFGMITVAPCVLEHVSTVSHKDFVLGRLQEFYKSANMTEQRLAIIRQDVSQWAQQSHGQLTKDMFQRYLQSKNVSWHINYLSGMIHQALCFTSAGTISQDECVVGIVAMTTPVMSSGNLALVDQVRMLIVFRILSPGSETCSVENLSKGIGNVLTTVGVEVARQQEIQKALEAYAKAVNVQSLDFQGVMDFAFQSNIRELSYLITQ